MNPIRIVVASFINEYSKRLVEVNGAISGFPSTAPKYTIPITVVNQSNEPAVISEKLGIVLISNTLFC